MLLASSVPAYQLCAPSIALSFMVTTAALAIDTAIAVSRDLRIRAVALRDLARCLGRTGRCRGLRRASQYRRKVRCPWPRWRRKRRQLELKASEFSSGLIRVIYHTTWSSEARMKLRGVSRGSVTNWFTKYLYIHLLTCIKCISRFYGLDLSYPFTILVERRIMKFWY